MSARSQAGRPRRKGTRGFTFVELLIALLLLGLMSVALVGGLRFGTRAWEAGTRQAQTAGKVERVQNLLRRQLTQPLAAPAGNAEVGSAFAGDPQSLVFVAPWLAQVGGGGATAFQLAGEEGDDGALLVLRWFPYGEDWDGTFPDDPDRTRVLVTGLEDLAISYYGVPPGAETAEWAEDWTGQRGPPALVAIEGRFDEADRRVWPRLVVAPRTAAVPRQ